MGGDPAKLNEVERAFADENYSSIQARSASVTASAAVLYYVDFRSNDPVHDRPCCRANTSVVQWIIPSDGRESGLDMIAFC